MLMFRKCCISNNWLHHPFQSNEGRLQAKVQVTSDTALVGRKGDPRNYRLVSPTSVLGNVTEQIILSEIIRHVREKRGSGPASMGS